MENNQTTKGEPAQMLYFYNHATDNQTSLRPHSGETLQDAAQRIATENGHGTLYWNNDLEPEDFEGNVICKAWQDNGETAGDYVIAYTEAPPFDEIDEIDE